MRRANDPQRREKIIQATLEAVKLYGIHAVTHRKIATLAGVRASALMGALGIGLIIFVDSAWVAGVSVVLWGLGASLGFPLTISAASDTGPDAPTRVSVVATTGYLAFLVGPPLLGYLGEHYGLRSAMLVVLALVILAAIVAKAVAKPDTKTQTAMENS